jgi:hypothetical protein
LAQVIVLALGADRGIAIRARLRTAGAQCLVAISATLQAAITAGPTAEGARGSAIVAQPIVAAFAPASVVVVNHRAACVARSSLPIRNLYVRSARGVGFDDAIDQQKEVAQPASGQSRFDRSPTISGAEDSIIDVRMGNFFIGYCGMRLQSDDVIGSIVLADPGPAQADLKWPQLQLFQDDGFCDYRYESLIEIDLHVRELALQGDEVRVDGAH